MFVWLFFQQQLLCVFFVLLFPQLQEPLVDAEFKTFAKSLGSRTVQSGSVSIGKNDPSQSLQMIERALLTPDELKSLPKGSFVVMKTGSHPMKVKLKLFFQWGIVFPQDIYTVPDKGNRKVSYAKYKVLEENIVKTNKNIVNPNISIVTQKPQISVIPRNNRN